MTFLFHKLQMINLLFETTASFSCQDPEGGLFKPNTLKENTVVHLTFSLKVFILFNPWNICVPYQLFKRTENSSMSFRRKFRLSIYEINEAKYKKRLIFQIDYQRGSKLFNQGFVIKFLVNVKILTISQGYF